MKTLKQRLQRLLQVRPGGVLEEPQFTFAGVEECLVEVRPTLLYLHRLKVSPLFQGQRLGSRALTELKKRGLPIRLIPYPDDPNRGEELKRFYVRNGFRSVTGDDNMQWNP